MDSLCTDSWVALHPLQIKLLCFIGGGGMGKWKKSKMLCDLNYKSMSLQGCSKMSNIPCLYFHLFFHTQSTSVDVWDGFLEYKGGLFLFIIFRDLGAIILSV